MNASLKIPNGKSETYIEEGRTTEKKNKITNTIRQNSTQETKEWATGGFCYSGKVNRSYSTSDLKLSLIPLNGFLDVN